MNHSGGHCILSSAGPTECAICFLPEVHLERMEGKSFVWIFAKKFGRSPQVCKTSGPVHLLQEVLPLAVMLIFEEF